MSMFIASLSLEGPTLVAAKTGVLTGSGLSIAVGPFALNVVLPRFMSSSHAGP